MRAKDLRRTRARVEMKRPVVLTGHHGDLALREHLLGEGTRPVVPLETRQLLLRRPRASAQRDRDSRARSPGARPASRRARAAAALVVSLLAGCGSFWRSAALPGVLARGATKSPGVLELEADRDFGEAWAKVLAPDGRAELTQCESVPCRAVLPPGRYHVVVGSGRLGLWIDAYHAEVDVEIAACVTDRIRVALPARLGPGRGQIVRQERVWLALDPGRIGKAPAGCAPPPPGAPPPPAAEALR